MKTRATARAERKKKPTQLDPPRHILYGPGDGFNRGPTRVVAPSNSHIEKLVIPYRLSETGGLVYAVFRLPVIPNWVAKQLVASVAICG
jgi:hypothetical protein